MKLNNYERELYKELRKDGKTRKEAKNWIAEYRQSYSNPPPPIWKERAIEAITGLKIMRKNKDD